MARKLFPPLFFSLSLSLGNTLGTHARVHAHARTRALGNSLCFLRVQLGCDTDFLSCPSDPSEVGALIKVSLCTCFYEDLLNIWLRHLKSEELKEWDVCVRVWVFECVCLRIEWNRKRNILCSSECLPASAWLLRWGKRGSRIPGQSFLSSQASGSPTCMFGQGVNNRSGIRLV